jgi:hypothetical protein
MLGRDHPRSMIGLQEANTVVGNARSRTMKPGPVPLTGGGGKGFYLSTDTAHTDFQELQPNGKKKGLPPVLPALAFSLHMLVDKVRAGPYRHSED